MVSMNRPTPSPEGPRGPKVPHGVAPVVEESFTDLVEVLYDPSRKEEVTHHAQRFYDAAVGALRQNLLPPEEFLLLLRLKDPQTNTFVFLEHGLLPRFLAAACHAVTEQVARGKPVSSQALTRLGGFAAAPHLAGAAFSVEAYRAMAIGATNFYHVSNESEKENALHVTPTLLLAQLMMSLHRSAEHHPVEVAEVIRALPSVPVDAHLLYGLDSLLVNTVHPARSSIPPMVREAAIHALADRVRKPSLRFACDEAVGAIDRHGAFELLVDVVHKRREPSVIAAAVSRIGEMLRDEVEGMLTTKEGMAQSSFVQSAPKSSPIATMASLGDRVGEIFAGHSDELAQRVAFLKAFHEAERVDIGLRINRVSSFVSSLAPSSWRGAVLGVVHWAYRLVDRGLRGPIDDPTTSELSTEIK
jgi:hypothetical protein